jgi:hypothetical protein
VLAQRLHRAGEQDAGGAAEAFLEHCMEEERLHFRLEETELFPLVERTLPEPALAASRDIASATTRPPPQQ